jgi:16S rRNA (guanine527-N7)-methyltransferase
MSEFDRQALTQQLRQGVARQEVVLSDAQIARLIDYLALLAKWNRTYNLTAVRDPAQMVVQHLLDSLVVLPAFAQAVNVLDVGSGGGLPGMVLAIWAGEARPAMKVAMIDTVNKKTAFLTQVKAELGLSNVTVHTGRVEQLEVANKFDVITSRAFAELSDFVTWSNHLLADGGRFLAMKGVQSDREEAGLPAGWKITANTPLKVPGLDAERHLITIERN